jgi:hypothetical protein
MTTDMGTTPPVEPMGTGGAGQSDNRQRNIIIGVVVGVVVLCCCCVLLPSLYVAYTCGDYFLGGPAGSCILAP